MFMGEWDSKWKILLILTFCFNFLGQFVFLDDLHDQECAGDVE